MASCVLALAAGFGLGQDQPARLEFEVASVRPAPPLDTTHGVTIGRRIDGAQVRFAQTSLRDYVRIAFHLRDYQIEAPAWMTSARYDVSAKLPAGCTQDQVPEMLRALLADRFALKTHRASKDMAVYALMVRAGGLKMKESPEPADDAPQKKPQEVKLSGGGGRGGIIDYGGGSYLALPHYGMHARKLPMDLFADLLGYFTDRPVINRTGLSGRYDFDLDLTEEDYDIMTNRAGMAMGERLSQRDLLEMAAGGDPLPAALRRLGLGFEHGRAPVEVLVVDDVRKMPTEN
jgi:uncharacterized protein (TIGR03435 family)